MSMTTLLLHSITPEELYEKIREIIREELKQDQLLTLEGALKMTGASKATFMKAINEGKINSQLVKDRKRAMYLESEVVKLPVRRSRKTTAQSSPPAEKE
jgi:hypothetical protein